MSTLCTECGALPLCARCDVENIGHARYVRILHQFSIWCAARALRHTRVTDPCAWAALRAKGRWLRGRATDADMYAARYDVHHAARHARDAAYDAAKEAAKNSTVYDPWAVARRKELDASKDAAMDAALTAALLDPCDAARATAENAERAVPWDITRKEERAAQASYLEARIARAIFLKG